MFYHFSKTSVGPACHKNCESPAEAPAKFDLMEKVCRNDVSTVAVKTIRFWSLPDLEPFLSPDYDLDFKSIILVRDPRSSFHSRKVLFTNLKHGKQAG